MFSFPCAGYKLLLELNDSLSRNYCMSYDIVDAKEAIKLSLAKLEQRQKEFSLAWDDFEKHLADLKSLTTFAEGIGFVTKWILSTGKDLTNEQKRIGEDLESSEELRDQHDALEMKCCDTYGFYAELSYKVKEFLKQKGPLTASSAALRDLLAQKQFMDFLCRSFANRLERRRIILMTCVRFYRFVTTYFDRTSQVIGTKPEENDIDVCVTNLQSLRTAKTVLGRAVKELEQEGEKLSDMLSMPVKDVFGRDTGIDYSENIATIQAILEETANRRKIFFDSVENQILRLEQIVHIHTYERDGLTATKWLEDLLTLAIETHSNVGNNIQEIQKQKQSLQVIQETAKVSLVGLKSDAR